MVGHDKLIIRFFSGLVFFFFIVFLGAAVYAQEIDAAVDIVETDEAYVFNFVNNESVAVFVYMNFPRIEGLTPSETIPFVKKLNPGTHKGIFDLQLDDDALRYSYSVKYTFFYSNPLTTVPDATLYYFPFKHGAKYKIVQAWNGAFTHRGLNQYAIDFNLSEGDEVYSARAGLVVAVKENSRRGGISSSYSDDANYVLILHSDGTMGNYAHLVYDGALVEVGDTVESNQLLGYSGNTGYSSGPHLHFVVLMPVKEGKLVSVPFKFRGKEGSAITPEDSEYYYSYFDEGEDFEEVFGSDLQVADFESYQQSLVGVEKNGNPILATRSETIDDVTIVYLQNFSEKKLSITAKLFLNNLKSDLAIPIIKVIPADTEHFLTILRPVLGKKNYSYRVRLEFQQ